jgi:hypothetical protein
MASIQIRVPDWLDRICVWPVMEYRQRRYGYSYRRIYLGEGEWTILDQQDYYKLSKFKWYLKGSFGKFYVARNYKYDSRQTKTVSMHREIMKAPEGLLVDHRNGDGLDNRRANLRLATQSENAYNRRKNGTKTTSPFRGVFFRKRRGRWIATIHCHRKMIWLGTFDSEIAAAKAYDGAAKKYHGEFARLNFPESADSVQRTVSSR